MTTYQETTVQTYTREQLLEKYHDVNVDHGSDWHEHVLEHQQELFKAAGWIVELEDMRFCGFWSQGDGASFIGQFVGSADTPAWIKTLLDADEVQVHAVRGSSRYAHHNTCRTELEEYGADLTEAQDALLVQFEADIEEQRVALCQQLYAALEEAYEYYTAEEQVWEWIECNVLDDLTVVEGD